MFHPTMLALWSAVRASGAPYQPVAVCLDSLHGGWREAHTRAGPRSGEPMMVTKQWFAFVRNLDWVTAHYGHR